MRSSSSFSPLFLLLPFLGLVVGCAQIRPLGIVDSERVFRKNYELGRRQIAYVGQAIVTVKEYMITRKRAPRMRATADFSITQLGIIIVSGKADMDYPVRGELTHEGTVYTVVAPPPSFWGQFNVLIAPDGSVLNRLLNNANFLVLSTFTIHPPGLRFISSFDETIDAQAGYVNFELLYGGTDGRSFNITYREYTSDSLIRPAFTQSLVYEAKSGTIRFRDHRLQIHEVTSEKLVYTVVADDLRAE